MGTLTIGIIIIVIIIAIAAYYGYQQQQDTLSTSNATILQNQQDQLIAQNAVDQSQVIANLQAQQAAAVQSQKDQLVAQQAAALKIQQDQLVAQQAAALKSQQDQLVAQQAAALQAQKDQLVAQQAAAVKAQQDQLAAQQAQAAAAAAAAAQAQALYNQQAAALQAAAAQVASSTYKFYQGVDSGGGDITQRADLANNVSGLQAACSSTAGCKGFNTNGWIKNTIQPLSAWYNWSSNPNQGFYIQTSALPAVYNFYQGLDSGGGDITQRGDLANNVPGLQYACNNAAGCKGFNTNGWIKNTISPQSQWTNWTSEPSKGFYLKQ